jgi:ATP adenylyltransferase
MVGRVLRNHGIVERDQKTYRLAGYENLSSDQVEELLALCQERLSIYLDKRGERVWEHRKQSSGYIPGTLRYEVLKSAGFHCELCGISADVKALEVDHITPRSKGGTDDLSNLQALCYSCNAMKRDRDDTDFRKIKGSYKVKDDSCPFCKITTDRIVLENELALALYDAFPVTALHTLIIPKRHSSSYFDLARPEINACNSLLAQAKGIIQELDGETSGYNIGVNDGEAAGQTVNHCHLHLIPRRKGDVDNPTGGVRNIFPGKGAY